MTWCLGGHIGCQSQQSLGSKRRDPSSAVAGHLGFGLTEFVRYGKEENYFDREPGREAIFIAFLTDLVTARFVFAAVKSFLSVAFWGALSSGASKLPVQIQAC